MSTPLDFSWVGVGAITPAGAGALDVTWPTWSLEQSSAACSVSFPDVYSQSEVTHEDSVGAASETVLEPYRYQMEVDSAIAGAEIIDAGLSLLTGESTADEQVYQFSIVGLETGAAATATAGVYPVSESVLLEEVSAHEAFLHSTSQVVLGGAALATTVTTPLGVSDRAVETAAKGSETLFFYSDSITVVEAHGADEIIDSVTHVALTGALAGAETHSSSLQNSDSLSSSSEALDEVFIQTETRAQLTSTAVASETPLHKDPGAIAWVMNTETAAPSWYSNWQFVDMVQVGDKVLAVGPEGLVELGAGTDAGEDIDAVLGYGFSELGGYDRRGNPSPDPQKKRVDSFWFGYTSDDVLEVSVETLGQPVYTYSMTARNAEQARNNRIRPGKGLNARYWRVVLTNVGGCEFDVDSIGADVVPTTRRL